MFCISVSFKKTPANVRQRFAFSKEETKVFLDKLIKEQWITGGVIVSTCNRSECYFTGSKAYLSKIENWFAGYKKIDREWMKQYCLYYSGKRAIQHLYKVTAGLDSMVLGEDEILRQVKEAYLSAKEQGFVNSELNIIFQGAFNCAKQTKSETAISNTPVSIGTLTANMVETYLEEKELPKKVLVIGATGKIGSIVAKDLISKGISVTGTTRSHIGEDGVMLQGGEGIAWIPFDKRYEVISGVAAVVSATGSPHYTITKDAFEKNCGKAQVYLMVDLAVPYDIDQDLAQLDKVTLYDIDYFENLSSENYNIKLNEIDKAKSILADCVEEVQKKLLIREFQVKQEETFQEKWFRKMISYLREALDSEQLEMVLTKIVKESKKEDWR